MKYKYRTVTSTVLDLEQCDSNSKTDPTVRSVMKDVDIIRKKNERLVQLFIHGETSSGIEYTAIFERPAKKKKKKKQDANENDAFRTPEDNS